MFFQADSPNPGLLATFAGNALGLNRCQMPRASLQHNEQKKEQMEQLFAR
jgi:hypothetical protein